MTPASHSSDTALFDVAAKQVAFKSRAMQSIMCQVVYRLLHDRIAWGDDIPLRYEGKDRNCVGTAFRLLQRSELVKPLNQWRRSNKPEQKGRKVWKYRLGSVELARTFLTRHNIDPDDSGLQMRLI